MKSIAFLSLFLFACSQTPEAGQGQDLDVKIDSGRADQSSPKSDLGRDDVRRADLDPTADLGTDLEDKPDLSSQDMSSNDMSEDATSEDVQPVEPKSGSFSVLIYNVAGLPALLSDADPATNIPIISPLLNAYDLVLVQEDFWYHNELKAGVTLPYASTPQDANPSVRNLHDGLNRFSRFQLAMLSRVKWTDCSGFSITGNNDCFARKGFSVGEVELEEGISILVYNLHMDAGRSRGDINARKKQSLQLGADIQSRATGRAIIVAGDTNMYFRRPDDVTNLAAFLTQTGLQDSCDALACMDNRVDRIFYRSSSDVNLLVSARHLPTEFVNPAGEDLSDHKPVSIDLDWEQILPQPF